MTGSLALSPEGLPITGLTTFTNFSGSTTNGVTTLTGSDQTLLGLATITLTYTGNDPMSGSVQIDVATLDLISGSGPIGATYTPCFVRGTHIQTVNGEKLVEDLRIGDLVMTVSGGAKPLIWIGTRSYDARFAGVYKRVCPVRIAASAIDERTPTRDLYVSPCHAILIDGVLIPAGALLNGITITQRPFGAQVDYFHLELEEHDIVIAEGVYSETFIDDHGRFMFSNAKEYYSMYPDREDVDAIYATLRVDDGEEVEAARARLADRARSISRIAA